MEQENTQVKEQEQKKKQPIFSAKKIAVMAVFTALAYVVSILDFSIFPAAPFLKLDFGNVFIMLVGFLYGPIEGIIVCVLKEVIHIPFGTTGGVGELANIISTTAYILVPSVLYRFKKGLKVVLPSLAIAIIVATAVNLPVNRFINFPLYMGGGAAEAFNGVWHFIVFFNLIKGAAIAAVTCILYKHISRLLNKI